MHLFLIHYFLTGSSLSDQVFQKPADIYKKTGEEAKIKCSHSIENFDRIYWYKQSNRQLQFLGYFYYTDGYPEKGVNVTMEGGSSKGQTCTLIIKELDLNSSAVYFCAASYTVLHITAPQYKNLHIISCVGYSSQPLAPGLSQS